MQFLRVATVAATALCLAGCGDSGGVDLNKAPGCFAKADLTVVVGGKPSDDPVAECGRYWTNGGIARRRRAPKLTLCVGRNETPWVFPGGRGVCERLGLEAP